MTGSMGNATSVTGGVASQGVVMMSAAATGASTGVATTSCGWDIVGVSE